MVLQYVLQKKRNEYFLNEILEHAVTKQKLVNLDGTNESPLEAHEPNTVKTSTKPLCIHFFMKYSKLSWNAIDKERIKARKENLRIND